MKRALRSLVLRNGANLDSKKLGEVPAGTRIVVLETADGANGTRRAHVEFQSTMENDDKGAILLNGWVTSVLADGTENFKEEEVVELPPPPTPQPTVSAPITPSTAAMTTARGTGTGTASVPHVATSSASSASSLDAALLSEALVFTAKECSIEAGGKSSLIVPVAPEGGFLLYQYEERSGEGVRFTVHAGEHQLLLDELQPVSDDRLHLPAGLGASALTLEWQNTESWIQSVVVSYTIRVVSTSAVRSKLDKQLLSAALAAQPAAVASLLAAGATVSSAVDRHGNSAMHLAALGGAGEPTLRALLDGGADVDARNADGATPLLLAAFRRGGGAASIGAGGASIGAGGGGASSGQDHHSAGGDTDASADATAAALVASRADVSVADSRGNTALMLAAGSGQAALVRLLLGANASPDPRNARGDTALSLAAARGSEATVAALLAEGFGGGGLSRRGSDGSSGQATLGASEGARALDEGGDGAADGGRGRRPSTVNARAEAAEAERALSLALSGGGSTGDFNPSDAALAERCRLAVRLLASPALPPESAMAALRHAPPPMLSLALRLSCQQGQELPTLRLLDAGAPLASAADATGAADGGPLAVAAAGGHAALVSLLLRRGNSAGRGEGGGVRGSPQLLRHEDCAHALELASRRGDVSVVDALLTHIEESEGDDGVSVGVGGAALRRALLVASGAGKTGLALILVERARRRGIEPCNGRGSEQSARGGGSEKEDFHETTPLHAAAAGGHTMLALALLRMDCCRLSALDGHGRSACQVAIERGFEQCALAIFQAGGEKEQAKVLLS